MSFQSLWTSTTFSPIPVRAGPVLQVARRREVVRVRMRVKNPDWRVALLFDEAQERISRMRACCAGLRLKIEHGVNERALLGIGIGDDVLNTACSLFEEGGDERFAS